MIWHSEKSSRWSEPHAHHLQDASWTMNNYKDGWSLPAGKFWTCNSYSTLPLPTLHFPSTYWWIYSIIGVGNLSSLEHHSFRAGQEHVVYPLAHWRNSLQLDLVMDKIWYPPSHTIKDSKRLQFLSHWPSFFISSLCHLARGTKFILIQRHNNYLTRKKINQNVPHLHGEKHMVLALEFGEHGEQIRPQKPSDIRFHETVKAWPSRSEPLQLMDHKDAFFPHLFLPPPDREARARSWWGRWREAAARKKEAPNSWSAAFAELSNGPSPQKTRSHGRHCAPLLLR